MKLAVVVPMLNEERAIGTTLRALRRGAPGATIIVVDGGSSDDSLVVASGLADQAVAGSRGRARQMNLGAELADSPDALVFVHADTVVPADFASQIAGALADPAVVGGRFDLRLDDPAWSFRLIERLINWRSRLTRSATGDQAIFVRRDTFARIGGFPPIDLCEDIDFARRLRRAGQVACLRAVVTTSARRWREQGLIRTVVRMWLIKALFLVGVSPRWLARRYRAAR